MGVNMEREVTLRGENVFINFLFFYQYYFKAAMFNVAVNWNCLVNCFPFTTPTHSLRPFGEKPTENIVGKERSADNQHFLFLIYNAFLRLQRHLPLSKPLLIVYLANTIDLFSIQ